MLGMLRDCGSGPEPRADGVVAIVQPSLDRTTAPVAREGDRCREREAWTILAAIPGLGPVSFGALLRRFGTGRAILDAASGPGGDRLLVRAGRDEPATLTVELARRIVEAAGGGDQLLERVRREGLAVVTLEDEAYPARLLGVEMPPHVLFVRGSPEAMSMRHIVAVVGTRRPSERGRHLAGRIAGAVSRLGASVVSGLAVGIDGAAHAAVVAQGLPTVAVLGGGHGQLYPRAHARLADAIVAAGGAVVSELPPDAAPTAGTFPRRNRLISGLSDATVVVEAARRSGALITASWALEQGRDCYLVPGPIDAPASAGCLAFLRECAGQARIVAGIPELLEDLGLVAAVASAGTPEAGRGRNATRRGSAPAGPEAILAELGEAEREVAKGLMGGPATADQLVAGTGLAVGAVLGTLTLLEMRGLVVSAYGRYRTAGLLAS